jgi:Tol biopolymer transport system component
VSCSKSSTLSPEEDGYATPGPMGYSDVDEYPSFSPDGNKIVYRHNAITEIIGIGTNINFDSTGIWIANIDGSNPRMLIKGMFINVDFSPDMKWIVFEGSAQILKVPFLGDSVDISRIESLTPGGRNFFPDWSPDGEWIAYDRSVSDEFGPYGLWIMRKDGSDKKHLYSYGMMPNWHPNGKSVICATGLDSLRWCKFLILYPFYNTSNDTLKVLKGNDNRHPKFSPDGTKIVFQSQPNANIPYICIMDSNGRNIRCLIDGYYPSWSPDGNKIVFIRSPFPYGVAWGLGTIWMINKDGSNLKQITQYTIKGIS